MKIYVVMLNDFPGGVFSTEEKAEAEMTRLGVDKFHSINNINNSEMKIYCQSYEFTVDQPIHKNWY
jgi:hypothetical protein